VAADVHIEAEVHVGGLGDGRSHQGNGQQQKKHVSHFRISFAMQDKNEPLPEEHDSCRRG
jgi:hypothetical protein